MRVGCILLLAIGFTGCGGEQPAEVSGMVLMDGAPLNKGEIIFEAVDKSRGAEGTNIVDGKYQLKMLAGSKKVQVKASRLLGAKDPVMGNSLYESMIDPEYNSKTTLTAEVKPGKNENVDFQVKSLPSSPKK